MEPNKLGSAYNEFGYYEHPVIMNRFFSQKRTLLIDINVWNVRIQEAFNGREVPLGISYSEVDYYNEYQLLRANNLSSSQYPFIDYNVKGMFTLNVF